MASINKLLDKPGFGIAILRIVVGFIFFMHGLDKFNGGIEGTAGFLTSLGIPAPTFMAILLIATELIGGIMLMLGLFTRYVAVAEAIAMVVALVTVHLDAGFSSREGGYEYVLALIAASVALVLLGSGSLALDNLLSPRLTGRQITARA
ncbi:MAG TPA: DoxX family protein [Herpetosiphon sp.]|uniref:DoxX family protein n=1 Tax=Herpetosiphon aurantiacus (strain ATCC 23779 / DSM 785 / 114-95) TaxID=316274 RepID=A9AV40_HERA2|nr:DoxX family protein [Herpetosiphon sp.]ABX03118.1 DoxX family protein [Herpetosiphon aurantiacus DSM 785]MCA0354666.1 DoxX family protein [Chloroflexota bacterium]HBW50780.1 DoxX family protein [Herpetosiphon sp.]